MKFSIIISTYLVFIFSLSAQKTIQKTLENGMQIVVKEKITNGSVAMYCIVKTGSMDEDEFLGTGMSHYLEHIINCGTTSLRTENEYLTLRKKIGAYQNAYTTYRTTCFQVHVNKKYIPEALSIISENMQFCTFDSNEVKRELEVIKKEYITRTTPPVTQLYNTNKRKCFLKSHYQDEILGCIDLFSQLTRNDLIKYYEKRYVPNNMIFVAVGEFKAEEMIDNIKNSFKDFRRKPLVPVIYPKEQVRTGNLKFVEEFDVTNPIGYITKIVEEGNYEDHVALDIASEILFGNRTSPVRYRLCEKEKLVSDLEGYFADGSTPMYPEKMIRIGFETDDVSKLDKIVTVIDDEIKNVLNEGIKSDQIKDIIAQFNAKNLLNDLTLLQECDKIGWNMMMYGKPVIENEYIAALEKIGSDDVERVIKKYFNDNDRIIFYGIPKEKNTKISNNQKKLENTEFEKIEVGKNLKLLYKLENSKSIVYTDICIPVSDRYETYENAGIMEFLIDILFKGGSYNYDSIELSSWLEAHSIAIKTKVDQFGTSIRFKTMKDDYNEILNKLEDIFKNPEFSENELNNAKKRFQDKYRRSLSDAQENHSLFRNKILFDGQKKAKTLKEINDYIQNLQRDEIFKLYEHFIKADKIVISIHGDMIRDEAINSSKRIQNFIPEGMIENENQISIAPKVNGIFTNEYNFEQCNLELNFPAPTLLEDDFFTMMFIHHVLSFGRLFRITREINNLAYSTSSIYNYSDVNAYLRIQSKTSKKNKEKLIEVLKNDIKEIINGDISADDIKTTVTISERNMKTVLNDELLASKMARYEAMGLGYRFIEDCIKRMSELTPEKVKNCARKYLSDVSIFVSYPPKDFVRNVE